MSQTDSPDDPEQHITVSSGAQDRRDVVAQATGVLAAQFGINTEDAFDKLAAVAQDEDRRMHDVAAEIVEKNGM